MLQYPNLLKNSDADHFDLFRNYYSNVFRSRPSKVNVALSLKLDMKMWRIVIFVLEIFPPGRPGNWSATGLVVTGSNL